jgi:hypothetical protein
MKLNPVKKFLKQYSQKEYFLFALIILLGLTLRLYPGKDRFLWIYDQARDAYRSRSVIAEKNIMITGPQTDHPGLNHGPLNYYFFAPFYFLSKGDPNLPGLAVILFNLSGIIPLFLLTESLFKKRSTAFLSIFLYAISYSMIEYARWIFNFSLSIPLLIWSYLFLWQALQHKKHAVWAGLTLALAIQGEIYLLYLIPFYYLFFLLHKVSRQMWIRFHLGLLIGGFTFVLAELKFKFLGVHTFFSSFIGGHAEPLDTATAINRYISFMGETVKHTLFGLSYPMGFLALIALLWFMWRRYSFLKQYYQEAVQFMVILLLSHSLLFTFHAPYKVFLNLPVYVPLIILTAFAISQLWQMKQRLAAGALLGLIIFFSLYQLHTNVVRQTPFELFNFIQTGKLFSQKLEIIDAMYELADSNEQFSLSVLGTPLNVQTVWASVFEQHHRRHQLPLPVWYGERALGYPADQFFPKVDAPKANHILLIESNQALISEYIRDSFLEEQDRVSSLEKEVALYGYRIQLRHPKTQVIQSESNL